MKWYRNTSSQGDEGERLYSLLDIIVEQEDSGYVWEPRLRLRLHISVFFFFFFTRLWDLQLLFMHKVWLFLAFFSQSVDTVHYLWTYKFHFPVTFLLKMSLTILFTHLKIILLQYFSVFCFSFQLCSNRPKPPHSKVGTFFHWCLGFLGEL